MTAQDATRDAIDATRVCASCGLELPLTQFHRDRSKPLGRSRRCGPCANIDHVAYVSKRYRTDPAFRASEVERTRRRRAEGRL